ncbi:MAG: hypothetical protein KDD36_06080 [Flavobacteriales bacterium]|nr:hypothetical protein [Flavobacteriales bacterium]
MEIRRTGKYFITAAWTSNGVMDDNEQVAGYIQVNGVTMTRQVEISGSSNWYLSSNSNLMIDLTAGDYIDFQVLHTEGSSQNTNTTLGYQPTIQVIEIR